MNTKLLITFIVIALGVSALMVMDTDESDAEVTASGTCGTDLNWSLEDTGVLTISGTGTTMDNFSSTNAPWYNYRTSINSVVFSTSALNLTNIGNNAFYSNTQGDYPITSVTLPLNLKTIGNYSFGYTEITSINFPATLNTIGQYAFRNCEGLTDITIPKNVTTINNQAFIGCINLKSVTNYSTLYISKETQNGYVGYYAESISNIPSGTCGSNLDWAYSEEDGIGTLTISGNGTTMTNYTSYSSPWYKYNSHIAYLVFHTPNLENIGNYAFGGIGPYDQGIHIQELVLPSSIKTIGRSAFAHCYQLKEISFPENLETIGLHAISYTSSLEQVIIPENVTLIEQNAFNYSGLNHLEINSRNCLIQVGAINNCDNLTACIIGENVESITGNNGLQNYKVKTLYFNAKNCTEFKHGIVSLTKIIVGEEVTQLPDSFAKDCTLLESVEWIGTPHITSIGDNAYYRCSALTYIEVPSTVTYIGQYAFRECGFSAIKMPDNLEYIGDSAFMQCRYLESISIPHKINSLPTFAFSDCSNLKTVYNYSPDITVVKGSQGNGRVGYYADTVYNALSSGTCGTDLNWVMWKESAGELIISGDGTVMENPTPSAYGGHASEVTTVTFNATNITTYGNNAFSGCTNLVMTEIPGGITEIGQNAFSGCATITVSEIPATVTNIGPSAFSGCTGLTSMSIPSTLTGLGAGAFEGCTALASVYYNAYNNQISATTPFVFAGCTSLSEVTIGENVHVIPNHLFRSVESLTTVNFDAVDCNELPEGNGVFVGTNVDTIIFGDNVGHIPSYLCKDMSATLESASFNDGLTSIGAHSFDGCSNLVVLALPDTVTDIHSYAFRNCTEVALTDLPSAIDDIGAHAFNGCTGNKINTLPVSLNNIHPYAFENNTGITGLYLPADLDIGIGSNAFLGCTNLKEILNLSAMEIEKGSTDNGYIAYYADAVADNFDDLAIIQQKEFVEHEVIEKTDATSTVLRIIPILIVLSITLGFIGMNPFTKRRTY